MEFSLFKKEKKIVKQAGQLIARQNSSPEELKECLATLAAALSRCYREQKRLIRISDRQQEQLRAMKEELLLKTDQLERQTADLRIFNKDLASEIAICRRAESELRVMANTDPLTGVNNRRRFLELLEREIKRTKRTGQALSLMIMDVDHFKTVNDRFGHAVGDQVLTHFVGVLLSNIREIDEIGRLGGEEFGMILPGTSARKALTIAKRLCSMVESREIVIPAKKISITITVSIGVAQLKERESGDQLIVRTDKALYVAKKNGRNRAEMARGDLDGVRQ